ATNTDFEQIAQCIVEIFPTESLKTYYIPPLSKADSRTKKSVPSSGKVPDKYRNKRRHSTVMSGKVKIRKTDMSQADSDDGDNDENVTQSIEWLKINREPWKDVEKHWQMTFCYRRKSIEKSEGGKVDSLFEHWPILKQPNGYLLIEKDFFAMKLTEVVITKEIWNVFFERVQKACKSHERDENAVLLLHLLALHDLSDGRCDDIATTQERIEKKSAESSTPLQPFIIVVGETWTSISEFYVCVDRVRYKVHSALSALNLLFQIYHVLDAGYPSASNHLWMLIQRSLYRFQTKHDKPISYVETIVKQIKDLEENEGTENKVQELSTEIDTDIEVSS
ncbi:hypothetical protein PV325_012923, partial [Microctonus aethiopoides]